MRLYKSQVHNIWLLPKTKNIMKLNCFHFGVKCYHQAFGNEKISKFQPKCRNMFVEDERLRDPHCRREHFGQHKTHDAVVEWFIPARNAVLLKILLYWAAGQYIWFKFLPLEGKTNVDNRPKVWETFAGYPYLTDTESPAETCHICLHNYCGQIPQNHHQLSHLQRSRTFGHVRLLPTSRSSASLPPSRTCTLPWLTSKYVFTDDELGSSGSLPESIG